LPDTVGDAGLLVPPLDVAAWREALSTISEQESLRRRLSAAGLEMVKRRNWESAAHEYLAIYREAVG
jgi:glycosyltransferase involved in cell wall biosynthesis